VYDEHVWRVYGFLAYRVSDRDTAEDLTQATFERALRAWPRFDSRRASERTWLLSIATNLLIDYRRRERSVLVASIDDRLLPAVPGPESLALGSPELLGALAELTEREQDVLALRYGGDLTGEEIAQLLGLTPDNVQQIASRSLRKLRALLAGARGQVPA
jgi:RNA polymerase sigma-70 factor (ECF subfamily)